MIDLLTIDRSKAMPSDVLNILIAREWMEYSNLEICLAVYWSPTTNATHAGEARRRAKCSTVIHCTTGCYVDLRGDVGRCAYNEVTGTPDEIKERAEALATCRAILSAIQVKETVNADA